MEENAHFEGKTKKYAEVQVERHILDFFMKSVLGRETNTCDTNMFIKACIGKAYDDMLSGGRFFGLRGKAENINNIFAILEKNNYCFSLELINNVKQKMFEGKDELVCNGRRATCFGLAQKIVNMTFKYLYCFRMYISDKEIDFQKCDCPVDSVILEKAQEFYHPAKKLKWTQLTEKEYKEFQQALDKREEDTSMYHCSKRLAYDFKW